ncbi:MAG: disulfide bond formation protein DsbA [Leptolyngbya foveolarum]|uniref:Disulfide bond formation protein DsbA n=1 Tax=Leptolyngbya foveolarum TaxID=47253 RepID=A0A2W4TY35_9CYAN|nr:MAG: disulfide bond formation protein DsbA [Leptolyngbya foveolarum]
MALTIRITSNFICPWCLVAESRLNKAIEQLDAPIEIEQVWQPFELNPDMPAAGMDRKRYRSDKFGSWAYSQQLDAQTVQATQSDDVEFQYDKIEVTPNTFNAHRLTWLAERSGLATEMATRILRAYFSEGQNISSTDTLVALAAEVGLEAEAVNAFLSSDEGAKEVRVLEQQAISQGIRGVPSMYIGDETIRGAQSVEAIVAALKKATRALEVSKK